MSCIIFENEKMSMKSIHAERSKSAPWQYASEIFSC